MCEPPTLPEEVEETVRQQRERCLQDLLLKLARENLRLRYEDGAEVPVTLADADDGSIELRVRGQSWQPWTNDSSELEPEVCARASSSPHSMDGAETTQDSEMGWDGRKLQVAWDQMQATSGRGRRGEEARREARRLKDAAMQVALANKSKCVLCGQTPKIVVPAPIVTTGRSGLPRFG